MHSKSPGDALLHIRKNIDLAHSFIEGMTFDTFYADRRTVYAVTRCLEIISEASRRLTPAMKRRHSEIPWKEMAAAGNVFRHDYEDVRDEIVWRTVQIRFESLRLAVESELERIRS